MSKKSAQHRRYNRAQKKGRAGARGDFDRFTCRNEMNENFGEGNELFMRFYFPDWCNPDDWSQDKTVYSRHCHFETLDGRFRFSAQNASLFVTNRSNPVLVDIATFLSTNEVPSAAIISFGG
jgi:hypothetical protein